MIEKIFFYGDIQRRKSFVDLSRYLRNDENLLRIDETGERKDDLVGR